MVDKDFFKDLTTPERLEKYLKGIEESDVHDEMKYGLIDFIKTLAEDVKLGKEMGLISEEDMAKFLDRDDVKT